MSLKLWEHEKGYRQHPEAIAEIEKLRAAESHRAPAPDKPVGPHTPEQQAEALVAIEQCCSNPDFQKKYWNTGEIGHTKAVKHWNSLHRVAHNSPIQADET